MPAILTFDKLVSQESIATQAAGDIIDIGRNKVFTVSVDGKCFINWSESGHAAQLPALTATDYDTLEFVAPDQIIRTDGSWVTDGYSVPGRTIIIANAADPANNGTFTVESATATDLTTVETTLENEAASAVESVNGTAPLEVDDTATLLPAADTYTFETCPGCEAVRLYNPSGVAALLATVFVSDNNN